MLGLPPTMQAVPSGAASSALHWPRLRLLPINAILTCSSMQASPSDARWLHSWPAETTRAQTRQPAAGSPTGTACCLLPAA